MIEVCSLDFLKKDTFEADILTANGSVLCSANDKVTPELILRLYFKNTYIKEPIAPKIPKEEKIPETEIIKKLEEIKPDFGVEPEAGLLNKPKTEEVKIEKEEVINLDEKLVFDEEEAKRVSGYSKLIGQTLNLAEPSLKELEQAGYYHNIGRTKFKKADLLDKDFQKKQAKAGYDIILNEKKLPEKIAEVALLCVVSYESNTFKLNEEIPYYQIIQIASFYDKLVQNNLSKEEALNKMLQLGGNKFNIFVLHKFINKMREQNG